MKIKIEFLSWVGRAALEIEARSIKEAVESATKDGANLYGANLEGANLDGANLDGAKYGDKQLWASRPVLQLGPCGRTGRTTVVFFFADGSEPLIRCGCFTGTLEEFREKIHETHEGTFHELEYNALASHIEAIYQIQKDELKKQETDNETL